LNTVTGTFPGLDSANLNASAERRFERKIRSLTRQAIGLPKHHPRGGNGCQFRLKRLEVDGKIKAAARPRAKILSAHWVGRARPFFARATARPSD
jgi:hypothetical protein